MIGHIVIVVGIFLLSIGSIWIVRYLVLLHKGETYFKGVLIEEHYKAGLGGLVVGIIIIYLAQTMLN